MGQAPMRITSDGTTWLANPSGIPERVIGLAGSTLFPYHDPSSTLVFVASPATDKPNKYEPFSPTLFKPRGSCITDFPRGGEYRMAVWGDASQVGTKKFSVGLGLAERDVFAPINLIRLDYTLWEVQTWNGWNGFVLVLPLVLFALLALLLLAIIAKCKPAWYGTASGFATPFRAMVLVSAGILLGQLVMNIAIIAWATGNAKVEETRELVFPIVTKVVIPFVTGTFTLLIGLAIPVCCCCQPKSARAGIPYRITVGLIGLLHLFVACGYILAPAMLMLAAILPPRTANHGHLSRAETAESHGKAKEAIGEAVQGLEVGNTPSTSSTVTTSI